MGQLTVPYVSLSVSLTVIGSHEVKILYSA